jgi:hypothetical protein
MNTISAQAESAVERLLKADEEQLYEQLGMRAKAIEKDPSIAGSFDPQVIYDQAQMGLKDDILELGHRLFRRWNAEAYNLVCGSEEKDTKDRENLTKAFGVSDAAVAAILSATLVTTFGLAPAIAAVIAAIIVKRFCRPAYEEFCRVWQKHISN